MHTASLADKPFIIFTPKKWDGSAGVYALHALGNNLLKLGCDVYYIFYDIAGHPPVTDEQEADYFYPNHSHNKTAWQERRGRLPNLQRAIVVYPESIPDNPLNAVNVVRYVMNYPEKNMYPMRPGPDDFFLTYFKEFYSISHCELPIFRFHDELLKRVDGRPKESRDINCTYIGKGVKVPGAYFLPDTVPILRDIPSTKSELFDLLSRTNYFFSWDPMTALNFEALICGALPVIIRTEPYFSDQLPICSRLGPFPHARITFDAHATPRIVVDEVLYPEQRIAYIDNILVLHNQELQLTLDFLSSCSAYFAGKTFKTAAS